MNASGGPAQLVVDTIEVQPRPFRHALSATGTLLPRESVSIQSERAGTVRSIEFEEGKPVEEGALLVRMDDTELQAERSRAQAQLVLAEANERRQKKLITTQGISQADYDQAAANLQVARANLELTLAQIAKTEIKAPFQGVAGLRQVSVGTYLTPGTPIVRFDALDSLKMDLSLPERYQDFVGIGTPVRFSLSGRDEKFAGKIYAIEPAVDVDTRSLLLRAEVPNPDGKLRPGAFAEVEVVLDEMPDALLIPAIALVPGPKNPTVYLFRDGRVEGRPVVAGIRTADEVQIESGLAPGDRIIVTGILQLRDGMQVAARPADQEAKAASADVAARDSPGAASSAAN